jgi:hypothetical protein
VNRSVNWELVGAISPMSSSRSIGSPLVESGSVLPSIPGRIRLFLFWVWPRPKN